MPKTAMSRTLEMDFDIPFDLKHDLVYCQRALTDYMIVHQEIAQSAHQWNIPSSRVQKSLSHLEKEIIEIGADQRNLFNRLRLFIDCYLLKNDAPVLNRKQLTDYVSQQIKSFTKFCNGRPMNIQYRLTPEELHSKYILNNTTVEQQSTIAVSEIKYKNDAFDNDNENNDIDTEIVGEVMEVLVSPEDISGPESLTYQEQQQEQYYQQQQLRQQQLQRKQESLLKPKEERISLPKDCESNSKPINGNIKRKSSPPSQPQQQTISLSRLKLKEALCKAKGIKSAPEELRVKIKCESPETITCLSSTNSKPITILSSSSQSSNSSCDDIFDSIDLSKEDQESTVLGKEPFLRLFGLYTHTYSHYLKKRRTQRKRRNCTSTEKGDFHYGRLDLFERQYANKRNKRQFLYSPPATRAKRQRRALNGDTDVTTSNGSDCINTKSTTTATTKVLKSNASSSSSLSSAPSLNNISSSARVCLSCFKRNNLLECKTCLGKYHLGCHISPSIDQTSKEKLCPYCWRQKNRVPNYYQRKKAKSYQISAK